MLQNDKDQNGTAEILWNTSGTGSTQQLNTGSSCRASEYTAYLCLCEERSKAERWITEKSSTSTDCIIGPCTKSMYEYAAVPVKKTPCDTEDRLGVIIVSTQVESLLYRPAPPH
jgi:hypothetical protein